MWDRPHIFHVFEDVGRGDGSRSLLDDLLVPPLHGAVSSEQGDGVAVLIGQDLHLQVTSVLGELHDENGRAGNFCLHL